MEPPPGPDPADAPRLSAVSPGADEVRVEAGDRVEFHVEATSPRSLPLSTTFLVDGVARATTSTFVFEPAAPGSYRIAAVVSDGELETTREWTVDVEPPPPVNRPPTAVLAIEPGGGTAPLAARFRVEGADPDGTVVRWRLELVGPDPLVVVRSSPIDTVLVLGAGSWQATGIVEDEAGATAVASRAVAVALPNQPPVPSLRVEPVSGPAPLEARVEASGHDPDGSVDRVRVDLDGDGDWDVDGTGPVARVVRYETAGIRWVRLAVSDDRGAEARDSVAVRVDSPPAPPPTPPPANAFPTAALTVTPGAGDAPLPVTAVASGSDADGAIVAVRIDFDGDGVADATGPGPSLEAGFVFAAPGERTVRAVVVDDAGATAAATATVTVRAAANEPPTGALTLDRTSGDAPLEVVITASGSDPDGRIVRWEVEADEGDGFVELDASRSARLVYGFDPSPYRPRLRLTDDGGATVVVAGPAVTVHRPIGGGRVTVAGNPRFDATAIAPAVWADGADPWRVEIRVETAGGDPLAGVPLRLVPDRDPLSAPDGTPLGPAAIPIPAAPVTGPDGAASATLVTDLSTRIERVPAIDFQPFALRVEADAGHGEWRAVGRVEGLNANTVVSGPTGRVVVHPAGVAVCPGTPIEIEVIARRTADAPLPGAPAADRYAELRYADGTLLGARPAGGYGSWRTDGQGVIRFDYAPSRSDQSKLVLAWVDGQPLGELGLIALRPVSECPS